MSMPSATHAQLRPMTKADLALVLSWRNHPQIRFHMHSQHEITAEEHKRWFEQALIDPCRWLLICEIDSISRGYINFQCTHSEEAIWGFYMAPDAPKGSGRYLGEAATSYAFSVLNLKKIWGEVLIDNVASQNFHTRHGFVAERTLKANKTDTNGASKVRRYSLTREKWIAHKVKENDDL